MILLAGFCNLGCLPFRSHISSVARQGKQAETEGKEMSKAAPISSLNSVKVV